MRVLDHGEVAWTDERVPPTEHIAHPERHMRVGRGVGTGAKDVGVEINRALDIIGP
jgi:hypothetical protein